MVKNCEKFSVEENFEDLINELHTVIQQNKTHISRGDQINRQKKSKGVDLRRNAGDNGYGV